MGQQTHRQIQVSTAPVACHIIATLRVMNNCHSVTAGEHVLTVPCPDSGIYQTGRLPRMNWCWLQIFTMVAMAPIQSLDGPSVVNQRSTTERGALVRMAIQTCRSSAPWQPRIDPSLSAHAGGQQYNCFQIYATHRGVGGDESASALQ